MHLPDTTVFPMAVKHEVNLYLLRDLPSLQAPLALVRSTSACSAKRFHLQLMVWPILLDFLVLVACAGDLFGHSFSLQ